MDTVRNFTLINHNTKHPLAPNGFRRGVGFLLNPAARKMWERAGSQRFAANGRIIAITLAHTPRKGQRSEFGLISAYSPVSNAPVSEHEQFASDLKAAFATFTSSCRFQVVMIDANADLGTNSADGAIGKFGLPKINQAGWRMRQLISDIGLQDTISHRPPSGKTIPGGKRRMDRRKNEKQGGSKRTKQQRWKKKQVQRERWLCQKQKPQRTSARSRRLRADEASRVQTRAEQDAFATWYHPQSDKAHTPDHILISSSALGRITTARVSAHWGNSDHKLIFCDISLEDTHRACRKALIGTVKRRRAITYIDRTQLKIESVRNSYLDACLQEPLTNELNITNQPPNTAPPPDLPPAQTQVQGQDPTTCFWRRLEERMSHAENALLRKDRKKKLGWYTAAADKLEAAMLRCNQTKQAKIKYRTAEARRQHKSAWKTMRQTIRRAQHEWKEKQIKICCKRVHNGVMAHPKLVYDTLKQLGDGLGDQPRPAQTLARRDAQGRLASTGQERLALATAHFKGVYSHDPHIEARVLGKLKQRKVSEGLVAPPGIQEVAAHMRDLKTDKAAGLSGIHPDLYRALSFDEEATEHITR